MLKHNLPNSPLSRAWRRLVASRSAWIGAAIVGLFFLVALTADWTAPYQPSFTAEDVAEPPSRAHWLGTDALRKDVLSRVMLGSRLSLLAGMISILLAVAIGTPLGAIAGYFGGRTDALLMRSIDVALAFPSVLIALLVAAAYRPSWATVVIAVGLINVPVFARQVRATVLSVAQLEYVLASRAFGAGPRHILTREILPSLVSPVVVLASLSLGTAILEVAGLSFLGLGQGLLDQERVVRDRPRCGDLADGPRLQSTWRRPARRTRPAERSESARLSVKSP
jgi:peptide/nickel transport system permease protein